MKFPCCVVCLFICCTPFHFLSYTNTVTTSHCALFAVSRSVTGFHGGCVWFNRLITYFSPPLIGSSNAEPHTQSTVAHMNTHTHKHTNSGLSRYVLLSCITQPQSVRFGSSSQHIKVSMLCGETLKYQLPVLQREVGIIHLSRQICFVRLMS